MGTDSPLRPDRLRDAVYARRVERLLSAFTSCALNLPPHETLRDASLFTGLLFVLRCVLIVKPLHSVLVRGHGNRAQLQQIFFESDSKHSFGLRCRSRRCTIGRDGMHAVFYL